MEIHQSENYRDGDWWDWSVWLRGTQAELASVEYVDWRLHPTFPDPVRRIKNRKSKFRLDTGGWGTFPVQALVRLKSGEVLRLSHELKLHYPDGTATTA
jgi:transcription initiation factor IIF auxiliary subunit